MIKHNKRNLVPIFVGLSGEAKPTGASVEDGAQLYEMDTKKNFTYDAKNRRWKDGSPFAGGGNDADISDLLSRTEALEDKTDENTAAIEDNAEAIEDLSGQIGAPTDAQLDAWFEAHPERTISLPDGSVTEAKLNSTIRDAIASVGLLSELKTSYKTDLVSAVNEVFVKGNARDHRLANLEAAARGYLYREETDDTPSEVKQVPADAMPYASVNSIGAKTLVWNQLYPERAAGQQTRVGVTTAWDGRTVTLSGTATSTTTLPVTLADKIPVRAGHRYALYLNCNTDFIRDTGTMFAELYRAAMGDALCRIPHNAPNTPAVGTAAVDGLPYLYLYVINGQNYDGIVIEPVVIDLTRMFGAGMEPDAAQLAAMLPELLHAEPDPGTVRTYTVSAVKDETSGAEIAFPTESLFPDGMYGIGDASDELDLVRMTAVRRIGAVRAASLTWSENANHPHSFGARLTGVASHSIGTPANVLNTEYDTKPYRSLYYAEEKGIGVIADGGRGLGFQICDPEADSVEALLEKLGDSMIYYQIETPEETPFPEELDPFLPVTAGETVRAEETDGARLDLPWSMTFLIDLTDREE